MGKFEYYSGPSTSSLLYNSDAAKNIANASERLVPALHFSITQIDRDSMRW